MTELIIAADAKGNAFQVTAEDAARFGYTPVPAKASATRATAQTRSRSTAPNKAVTPAISGKDSEGTAQTKDGESSDETTTSDTGDE